VSYHFLTSGSSKCLPLRFAAGMPTINVPAVLQPSHLKVLVDALEDGSLHFYCRFARC